MSDNHIYDALRQKGLVPIQPWERVIHDGTYGIAPRLQRWDAHCQPHRVCRLVVQTLPSHLLGCNVNKVPGPLHKVQYVVFRSRHKTRHGRLHCNISGRVAQWIARGLQVSGEERLWRMPAKSIEILDWLNTFMSPKSVLLRVARQCNGQYADHHQRTGTDCQVSSQRLLLPCLRLTFDPCSCHLRMPQIKNTLQLIVQTVSAFLSA